jgi:5-carboxymethyl-2-hydroxymuconate isomerase
MPHIIIECSANLGERVDFDELVRTVHGAALETGVFPIGGTRTRLAVRERFRIADGEPDNAFAHTVLRIGAGRDAATKKAAGNHVFAALCGVLAPAYAAGPLSISLEVQELDTALSFKQNNIHEYVANRRAARDGTGAAATALAAEVGTAAGNKAVAGTHV